MRQPSRVSQICIGALALCLSLSCVGCSNSAQDEAETEAMVETAITSAGVDVTDVAAVVNGTIISQQQIDDALQAERIRYGLEDDDVWQDDLDRAGLTEWDVRASLTKSMIDNALIEAEAEALGIDVEDEVSERLASTEAFYPSHESFVEAIQAKGYTEETYKNALRRSLLWEAVSDEIVDSTDPTDEQIRQYVSVVAPTLAGRRSSHILFASTDYALANEVLEELDNGADFAELAAEYSIDSTADNGGDMGWDSINNMVSPYQSALDELEPGEYTGPVRTRFGYHIIMCTDKYDAPLDEDGNVDLDAIPDDLMDILVSSMSENLASQQFELCLANLEATALVAVFNVDGEQVPVEEIGLAVEETKTDADVDEVVAEAQSAGESGETVISSTTADTGSTSTESTVDPVDVEDPVSGASSVLENL